VIKVINNYKLVLTMEKNVNIV